MNKPLDISQVGAIQQIFNTLEIVLLDLQGVEIWRKRYSSREVFDSSAKVMIKKLHKELERRDNDKTGS